MENEYVKKMKDQRYLREQTLYSGRESFKKVEKLSEALVHLKYTDFSLERGPSSIFFRIYPRNRSRSVFGVSFDARSDGVIIHIINAPSNIDGFTDSDSQKICRYLAIPLDPKVMDKVLGVLVESDVLNFSLDQCANLENKCAEGYMSFSGTQNKIPVQVPASALYKLRQFRNRVTYFDLPGYSTVKRFDVDPKKLTEFCTEWFTVTKDGDEQLMTVTDDVIRIRGLVTVHESCKTIHGLST